MQGSKLLYIASWLILLVVGVAITLGAFGSLRVAYRGGQDGLTQGLTLNEIRDLGNQIREGGGEEAVKAFKGRRATAATWAIGYGLLMLVVVLGPYRRGERWAWWALLVSMGLSQLLSLARSPMLGTTQGLNTPGLILAFALLGLLAGAPRIFARSRATTDEETA